MQSYIIGIDIGTGSTKAVAVDHKGNILANKQVAYPTLYPQPGYSEQNPDVIWRAFVSSVQQVVDQLQQLPAALSLSSAMHSLVAVDAQGQPLMPLITWADTRSEAVAATIRQSESAETLYRQTGTPLHAMTPLCKLAWLQQNRPDLIAQAAQFISIKEYIWYQLFRTFEVDYSIASATGLFDIHTKKWNEGALNVAGVLPDQLSIPVPTHFIRSGLTEAAAAVLHLPPNTAVCIGASDGCLANLGTFATEQGIAAITIGTSGAVRITSQQPLMAYEAMLFSYLLDNHTFVCGGPINNGGNVLQWLLRRFLQIEITEAHYADVFQQIETIPAGSDGLLFLPYLYGERAPIWDEKSCGVFLGIRQRHTKAHFLRAALEGVCLAIKDVLQIVEQTAGTVHQIQVSGGIVHSATWMQLMADVTGKKLCLVQSEDASALGAAYLAMCAMNWITGYAALKQGAEQIIYPHTDTQTVYEKNFRIFKQLYPSLKGAMHQLVSG